MTGTIGLGSNLGRREANLRAGIDDLGRAGVGILAESSVWESEPVGTVSPGWFLNMVVKVRTELEPLRLLELMLEIERRRGRLRRERNGPRTLDLDLLTLGRLRAEGPRLTLPHPRMWERRFVLEPLAEVAPELCHPETGRPVSAVLASLEDRSLVRKAGLLAPARAVPL